MPVKKRRKHLTAAERAEIHSWWSERMAALVYRDFADREALRAREAYRKVGARKQIAARLNVHEGTVDNIVAKYAKHTKYAEGKP